MSYPKVTDNVPNRTEDNMHTDMQDILAEYAEGLAQGYISPGELVEKYNIPPGSEAEALVYFAAKLEFVLREVQPSEAFVAQLRAELLGQETLVERLRALTPAQVMAGIGGMTMVAGLFWFVRRTAQERRNPDALNGVAIISPLAS